MTQDLDLLLEKACSTAEGRLKATFMHSELEKLAPFFADEGTRAATEEALETWAAIGNDPLRKGMATAWLARARSSLAPHVAEVLNGAKNGVAAVRSAAGAVKGAAATAGKTAMRPYEAGKEAAGNLGAAAGEKIANSKLMSGKRAALQAKHGATVRGRLADRINAGKPTQYPQLLDPVDDATAHAPKGGFLQHEAQPGPRLEPQADPHADALSAAFRSGADHAAKIHAKASARIGRVAARHAFKAGAQLGAAGVGVAAAGAYAGHLSEKQRQQRVEAGKHSHDNRRAAPQFGKAAGVDGLGKLAGAASVLGHSIVDAVAPASVQHAIGMQTGAEAMRSKADATRARKAAFHARLKTQLAPKTPKVPGAV